MTDAADLARSIPSSADVRPPSPLAPPPRPRLARGLYFVLWVECGFALAVVAWVLLAPILFRHVAQASGDTTKHQLRALAGGVASYVGEHRALPPELGTLATPGATKEGPLFSRVPLDPWGGLYAYRILDPAAHRYEIRSAGEDLRFGTEDDIVFPAPKAR